MNTAKQWWKTTSRTKKIMTAVIVIIVIGILFLIFKKKPSTVATTTVQQGNVINSLVLSGTTDSASAVNLGFATQGRVASVSVVEGQKVHAGQVIATLDTADLQASLKSAQAALVIAKANASNTSTNLDTVTIQQDTLVQNAHNTLLSDHLQAVPKNLSTAATAPIITGSYTGTEGSYIVHTYPSGNNSGESFSISGLENGFNAEASASGPVPLGSRGLSIQFQSNPSIYGTSDWIISIPNTQSPTYTADLNAYNAAVATRTQVITAAAASASTTSSQSSISAAQIQQAQAQVDSVVAQMRQREIIVPFDGTIAAVNVKPGQTTNSFNPSSSSTDSANANISLISESDYEVVLKTPEIDVASLAVGQPVSMTLDAFGAGTTFSGSITSIDPAETIVDGVPIYQTKVVFTKLDPRIRSGMTATATITIAEKDNVVSLPISFVHTDSSGSYVYVISGDHSVKTAVTVGLRGSDSTVEITSGLTAGTAVQSEAK